MIQKLFNVRDQVAIVTGGNSGIGFSVADTLTKCGAKVAIMNRNAETGMKAAAMLREQGGEAHAFPGDVKVKEKVEEVVEAVESHLGPVDILVNCAGINIRKKAVEYDLDEWQRVLDINLTGTFVVCQAVGRRMISRGKGRIINISSIASLIGMPDRAPYCASKAGVSQLTKALAVEWAPYGLTVNAIGPGFIHTQLISELLKDPAFQKQIKDSVPLQRVGETADLQGILMVFCSDAGKYLTGQTIYVDGGQSIC